VHQQRWIGTLKTFNQQIQPYLTTETTTPRA
jgi:hypothetical protein